MPLLVTLALAQGVLHASLDHFQPRSYDELDNWHEIATFVVAGFKGGNYGHENLAAPVAALGLGSYGPHGVGLAMLYGLPARVFGWQAASPPLYNLFFLTAGLATMTLCMRPGRAFCLAAAALMASCAYVFMYSSTMTAEAALIGLCCAMAGFFWRLATDFPRKGWTLWAFLLALAITAASMLRYSYALLVFALLLFTDNPKTSRQWLAWFAKGTIMAGVLVAFYMAFASPFPYDAFPGSEFGMQLYAKVLRGDLDAFRHHLRINIAAAFAPTSYNAYHIFFLGIVCFAVFFPLQALLRSMQETTPDLRRRDSLVAAFHVINLLGNLFILFFYYYTMLDDFGTRLLTPSLFLSLFLALRLFPGRWWLPLLALHLALWPLWLRDYRSIMPAYFEEMPSDGEYREVQVQLQTHLRYDPSASSWCNTLQTYGFYNFSWQLGVPPGMGINETRGQSDDKLTARSIRGGFVLTHGEQNQKLAADNANLLPVAMGAQWTLFRNDGCAAKKDEVSQ